MAPTTAWRTLLPGAARRSAAVARSERRAGLRARPGGAGAGRAQAAGRGARRARWRRPRRCWRAATGARRAGRHAPAGLRAGARGPRPAAAAPGATGAGAAPRSNAAASRRARWATAGGSRPDYPACERWEPPVDCLTCGACCREAYHSVSVSVRDPVVWKQPGAGGARRPPLQPAARRGSLRGAGGRQRPAAGRGARYHCRIYEDRPRTCREFERGGRHCLVARRRVGLSARPRRGRRSSICSSRSPRPRRRCRAGGARPGPVGRPALGPVRVVRRSLDARKGRPLGYNLRLAVGAPGSCRRRPQPARRAGRPGGPLPRVVIIGSGPAGTFAALRLAEAGVPSTILERGKPVQPRRHDLAQLQRGDAEPRRPTTASARAGRAPTPTASSTPAARIARASARVLRRSGALRRARTRSRSSRGRTWARTACPRC